MGKSNRKYKNRNKNASLTSGNIWLADEAEMTNIINVLSSDYQRAMDGDFADGSSVGGGEATENIINVHGSLFPREDLLTRYFGLTTYTGIEHQLSELEGKLETGATVYLDIDSGGGNGNGLFQLGERINQSSLNVVAYVSGRAASAAYVIAAACSEIQMGESAEVGCLGVITQYITDEMKPKNLILSRYAENKISNKEDTQTNADKLEEIMYSKIHEWSGSTDEFDIEKSAEKFGHGRMFFGFDAKEKGMAQSVVNIAPYKNNKTGGVMPDYSEVDLQAKLAEKEVELNADFESKLEDLSNRFEVLLSSDAGKANPSEAIRFAKDSRFSIDESKELLSKMTPVEVKTEEVEDEGDPLAEAIAATGGTADLSTLAQEQELVVEEKEKPTAAPVAKYGSQMQDTFKLAKGEFEGGLEAYNAIWGSLEVNNGEQE